MEMMMTKTDDRHETMLAIMDVIGTARADGSGGNVVHYGDPATADWQVVWRDAWSNACHTVHVFHIDDVWNESDAIAAAMDAYRDRLERDGEDADTIDCALEWLRDDVWNVSMPGMG